MTSSTNTVSRSDLALLESRLRSALATAESKRFVSTGNLWFALYITWLVIVVAIVMLASSFAEHDHGGPATPTSRPAPIAEGRVP